MKDILSEMKNNFRELATGERVDEAENPKLWNIRKQKTSNQNSKKKIFLNPTK